MHNRPINVECDLSTLTNEGWEWLERYAKDLVWCNYGWRVWDSPAEYHELLPYEQLEHKFYTQRGKPYNFPIRKRSIDVVRFACKRDALYFKLVFLS